MKVPTAESRTPHLSELMFEMGRKVKGALARDFAPFSMLHVETLRFISESGEPSMREVADYLRIAAPTATALTDGLVEDGCIVRRVDKSDRRLVRLALSAKGRKLIANLHRKRTAAFSRIIAPLSSRDRHEFARILRIITAR